MRPARCFLDELLKPDVKFEWNHKHQRAFDMCKRLAGNSARLTHFDAKKPNVVDDRCKSIWNRSLPKS